MGERKGRCTKVGAFLEGEGRWMREEKGEARKKKRKYEQLRKGPLRCFPPVRAALPLTLTLTMTMTLTMQCHMTTKTFPFAGSGKSHSIKSSLVPVPETPKVLCIRLNEKGKKKKVHLKQDHEEPPWESQKESERRMRRRGEGGGK